MDHRMDDEQLEEVLRSVERVAASIMPNLAGSADASGMHVESLTEAVMGMTHGLYAIASAIEFLGNVVRER